jgi:hypothetical protein
MIDKDLIDDDLTIILRLLNSLDHKLDRVPPWS